MQKKLTITIDAKVYEGLRRTIRPGHISRFIEDLVRPHVLGEELEAAYSQMAQDEEREADALDWSEAALQGASSNPEREVALAGNNGGILYM